MYKIEYLIVHNSKFGDFEGCKPGRTEVKDMDDFILWFNHNNYEKYDDGDYDVLEIKKIVPIK